MIMTKTEINMSTKINDNGNIHHNMYNRSSVVFKDDLIEHVEISPKPGEHLLPNLESIVATSDGESTDSNDSNNSKDSKENFKQDSTDSDNGTCKKQKIPQHVKAQREGLAMHMSRVDNPTNRNERNKNKHNDSNDKSNVSIEHTNKVLKPLRELPEIPI